MLLRTTVNLTKGSQAKGSSVVGRDYLLSKRHRQGRLRLLPSYDFC